MRTTRKESAPVSRDERSRKDALPAFVDVPAGKRSSARLTTLTRQPLRNRLPLLPILPREILRKLEDAHAALERAEVVRRLAQRAQVRHLELGQIPIELFVQQRVLAHSVRDDGEAGLGALDFAEVEKLRHEMSARFHVDR